MHITKATSVPSVSTFLVLGGGTATGSCGGGTGDNPATGLGPATTATGPSTTATAGGTDSDGSSPGSDSDGSDSDGSGTAGPGPTGPGPGPTGTAGGIPKFDVGSTLDVPGSEGEDTGCKKIDFLFLIDNSGSMRRDEQVALAASFPRFITEIQDTVMARDYHIMVVDTDAPAGLPSSCEDGLGAGLTWDENEVDCGITSGHRYMLDTQPDLSLTFQCLALAGTRGNSTERPMESMERAITVHNPPGECNGGFVRDDTILVVTFITDEEDNGKSSGDPVSWKTAVVGAKNGDEDAMVVLGLIGDSDVTNGVCRTMGSAEGSPVLRSFAESFNFGSWGSICSLDYTPFFSAAVEEVKGACDGFQPPG